MVSSVIRASTNRPEIRMEPEIGEATQALRAFLFENVYTHSVAKAEDGKAKGLLIRLFDYFVKNPEKMPETYRRNLEEEGVERCVCDFISGMTDRYAIEMNRELFVPSVWGM